MQAAGGPRQDTRRRRGTVDFLLPLRLKAQKHQLAGRVGPGEAGHKGLLWMTEGTGCTVLQSVDSLATQFTAQSHTITPHPHARLGTQDMKMNKNTASFPGHLHPPQNLVSPAPNLSLVNPTSLPDLKPEGSAAWCFLRPFYSFFFFF